MRFHKLERLFPVVVVSGAEGCVKPEPEIFSLALKRAGVAAHEAVMVGDSYKEDAIASKEAGMSCI